jgi:hypothetical protein
MNPRRRIFPPPSANGLLGGRMSARRQFNFLSLGWETILKGGRTTSLPKA